MNTAVDTQPQPKSNESTPIVDKVIADLEVRKEFGLKKYGIALQAHNGRDALLDAYFEALDLAIYLRQAIEERNAEHTITIIP